MECEHKYFILEELKQTREELLLARSERRALGEKIDRVLLVVSGKENRTKLWVAAIAAFAALTGSIALVVVALV